MTIPTRTALRQIRQALGDTTGRIHPRTVALAEMVALLPIQKGEIARSIGVRADRLSGWLSLAKGTQLAAKNCSNWPPTEEHVLAVRAMVEAHADDVTRYLAR